MLPDGCSECFLNRPAKHVYALIYGSWFDFELASPLLKRECYPVTGKHYDTTPVFCYAWGRKCLFERPSNRKTMSKGFLADPQLVGPVLQAHRFSMKRKKGVVASVSVLFFPCAPSAIIWSIVSIIVDSVNGMVWTRSWSHVFQEVVEAIQPSLAYRYASSSISMVSSGIPVIASLLHRFPAFVSFSLLLFNGLARILFIHLKLLYSFMVARVRAVLQHCLRSFHCSVCGRLVKHVP